MTNPEEKPSRAFLCRSTWASVDDYVRSLTVLLCFTTIDGLFIITLLNKPTEFNSWLIFVVSVLPITGMLIWYWGGKVNAVWVDFNAVKEREPKSIMVFIEFLVIMYFMLSTIAAIPMLAALVSKNNWALLKSF